MPNTDVQSHPSDSSTNSSLIRRVQSFDQDAWRQLTDLYGPLVFHWCRRMGLDGDDAADIFQEVFTTVTKTIGRFDPVRKSGTFRGWLWRITRNKILDHWRHQQGRPLATGGTEAQIRLADFSDPFTDESVDETDRSETSSLFHRALQMIEAEFEPQTWKAFWRATVELQDTASIADDLEMSRASVRQAKSRVLRRLRQILGDLPS